MMFVDATRTYTGKCLLAYVPPSRWGNRIDDRDVLGMVFGDDTVPDREPDDDYDPTDDYDPDPDPLGLMADIEANRYEQHMRNMSP